MAHVLTVAIFDPALKQTGRGECVPYAHYGETMGGTQDQIASVAAQVAAGASRSDLLDLLPAGAARNGIDAALWDLDFKAARASRSPSPWEGPIGPVRTVRTLSLATPEEMASEATRVAPNFSSLKLKLGGEPGNADIDRVAAVRAAVPDHQLVVDANESWSPDVVELRIEALVPFALSLVEQPVPADQDAILETFKSAIPLCADESFHTTADLDRIAARYDIVNLKLDKTGGLTHALEAKTAASALGLDIMVGCMVGTSLAMAPALILAQGVDLVDLDGPYLLAEDRKPALDLGQDGWIKPRLDFWG